LEGFSLDYNGIHEYQQNSYPYLMIDYVNEVIPGKSAKGYKYLTSNDWFFKCHFPGDPSMPGMLQIEALVQMFALTVLTLEGNKGKVAYLANADNLKFSRKVLPGDKLDIETELLSWKRGVGKGKGKGYVNGAIACCADFTVTIPDILQQYLR
jgi:3-hydroxyacyl-[acyl-carrier-protein] dehydratase